MLMKMGCVLPFFLSLIISISMLTSCHSSGFSSRLLRLSTYNSSNLNKAQQFQLLLDSSLARKNYLLSPQLRSAQDLIRSVDNQYVMAFSIGSPPVRTYGILDTGSSLTWLQCIPCEECINQTRVPLFNSATSITFRQLHCDTQYCWNTVGTTCTNDGYCQFRKTYGDESTASGDLALEEFTFGEQVYNDTFRIIFGCAHKAVSTTPGEGIPSIIGLGRHRESLLLQLSYSKFSYCMGPYEMGDAPGFVSIGDVARIVGDTTPILSSGNYPWYLMSLEGISVGPNRLPLPNDTFTLNPDELIPGTSGFMIDSGAAATHLNRTAFNVLVEELKRQLLPRETVFVGEVACFKLTDGVPIPKVTFHFTGANLVLPFDNTFHLGRDDFYCLVMLPTDSISMLGNYQQQDLNVGYDLGNSTISLAFLPCTHL